MGKYLYKTPYVKAWKVGSSERVPSFIQKYMDKGSWIHEDVKAYIRPLDPPEWASAEEEAEFLGLRGKWIIPSYIMMIRGDGMFRIYDGNWIVEDLNYGILLVMSDDEFTKTYDPF